MADTIPGGRFTNITATIFGGPGDEQPTAYKDVKAGWPDRPGVALPYRFSSARPTVRVSRGGKSIDCPIVDVGPWYPSSKGPADPYWETGSRPRAESDGRTNSAGIDLTPATARALGIAGKGKVDWKFVGAAAVTQPAPPSAPTSTRTVWDRFLDWFAGRHPSPSAPPPGPAPEQKPVPTSDGVPPWLATMRSLKGTSWMPGQKMPPAIQEWVAFLSRKYPGDIADYLARAGTNYFSCCGLGAAYCLAQAGYRPPFGKTDLDRFLWADSWRTEKWGVVPDIAEPGDVLTFDFGAGDHHVTILDHVAGDTYVCWGANQNHQVKSSPYHKDECTSIRRPVAWC